MMLRKQPRLMFCQDILRPVDGISCSQTALDFVYIDFLMLLEGSKTAHFCFWFLAFVC